MKTRKLFPFIGMLIAAGIFAACGGGGGSSSSTGSNPATLGVAVDPYIVGASFFEDLNANGIHDAAEQLSTRSNEFGEFSFSQPLTVGATVIMKEKGKHNGLPFPGILKRLVQSGDNGILVVSPLTTLLANHITPQELRQLLEGAGLTGLLEDDLLRNPMESLEALKASEIDEAKLRLLQAAMTVNSFLSIVGYDATYEDCNSETGRALLRNLVGVVKGALNVTFVQSISQKLEGALAPLDAGNLFPAVTVTEACNTAATVIQSYANKIKAYMQELPSLHPDEIVALLPPIGSLLDECSLKNLTPVNVTFYVDINRSDPEIENAIVRKVLEDSLICKVRVDVNSIDSQGCAITATVTCDPANSGGSPGPGPTPEPPRMMNIGWVNSFNPGFTKILDYPKSMAVDSSGSLYITGTSRGEGTSFDILTIKYSSQGTLLWSKRFNGPANAADEAAGLVLDTIGNVYVVGSTTTANDTANFVTIKYNTNGTEIWVRQYDGPAGFEDDPNAIATDSEGNVYVSGTSMNTIWFGVNDYATVKYDKDGNEIWAARYAGPVSGLNSAAALVVDGSGSVYVTGASQGSGTGLDFATIKYNSAGLEQWVKRYHNSQDDLAVAIALLPSGDIVVTGLSVGVGNSSDYATVCYDSDGNEKWVTRTDSPESAQDQPVAIAVDGIGNSYVTGTAGTEIWNANSGYFTVKLDSTGAQQWAVRYDGPGNSWDRANGLSLDSAGNVYVTGQSKGVDTASDYATVSYTSAGEIRWIERYDGGSKSDDGAVAVAVDTAGNVYVTGSTGQGADQTQITTIKYVP